VKTSKAPVAASAQRSMPIADRIEHSLRCRFGDLTIEIAIFVPVQDLKHAQDAMGDPALWWLTEQQMGGAKGAARAAADALMLTDASLLFPPGQLALAAMRSGFNKVRKACVCYVMRSIAQMLSFEGSASRY